ncbi:MAG: hypothetical protein V5A45_03230 [Haloarculaceae archaeon]
MVSDCYGQNGAGADEYSRAQLILLASIAIALVIIGLSVLINTVLFTESVGSSSLDNRIDETREFDGEVTTGVRSLVFRIGHDSRNMTETELRAAVAQNVTRYSRAIGDSYATSRPVAVSLSYSNASRVGNRTVQGVDANLTSDDGATDWKPVSDRTVGWFTLNIDTLETNREPTHINATNTTSSRWVNVSINRTQSGNISVSSTVSFAAGATATCTPVDGRVLLDIYGGAALTESSADCSFNGTSTLDGPYDIDIGNGDNLVGKYSLVTREAIPAGTTLPCTDPGASTPCVAPVLWNASISTVFEGESVSYDNTYNVSIYGENP